MFGRFKSTFPALHLQEYSKPPPNPTFTVKVTPHEQQCFLEPSRDQHLIYLNGVNLNNPSISDTFWFQSSVGCSFDLSGIEAISNVFTSFQSPSQSNRFSQSAKLSRFVTLTVSNKCSSSTFLLASIQYSKIYTSTKCQVFDLKLASLER